MNPAIETLREQLDRYDMWYGGLNAEIEDLESRIKTLKQERAEFLNKVEAINEAIWKLQNATR